MEVSRQKQLIQFIFKFLKVIWGVQWLVLALTIIYALFGLDYNTFFFFQLFSRPC